MEGREYRSPEIEMDGSDSWSSRINKHKRPLGAAFGLLALLALGAKREHEDSSTDITSHEEIALNPTDTSLAVNAEPVYVSETEKQEALLRQVAFAELNLELDSITSGEDLDGRYSAELINLESAGEEIGNDFRKIIETTVAESRSMHGQAKLEFLQDSIGLLLDHYRKVAEGMSGMERIQFRQEGALALSTLINEYLAGKPAGSLEKATASAAEAGLVNDVESVVREMGLSLERGKIEDGSLWMGSEGDGVARLEVPQLLEVFYGQSVEVPLELAGGVELTNLYDIRDTDPAQYEKIVDRLLADNSQLVDYAKIALGKELAPAELKNMLMTGEREDISETLPWFERVSVDFEMTKLWDKIPMPAVDIKWSGDTTERQFRYLLNTTGGQIAPTMLCRGNHIEVISLSGESSVVTPEKNGLQIPMLVLLLPLLAFFKRRKRKGTNQTPEDNPSLTSTPEASSIPVRQPMPVGRPVPIGAPIPQGEPVPMNRPDSESNSIEAPFDLSATKAAESASPEPVIVSGTSEIGPVTISEMEPGGAPITELKKKSDDIVYRFDQNGQMFIYIPAESEASNSEERWVGAKILVALDGSVKIIETGEIDPTQFVSEEYKVVKAEKV